MLCLKVYNSGPNALHKWLYMATSYVPLGILMIGMLTMTFKNIKLNTQSSDPPSSCSIHIHQYYVARIVLSTIIHLAVVMIAVIFIWIFKRKQMILGDIHKCLFENSTIRCVDGKAGSRSNLNIACFLIHCVFFLYNLFELVYFLRKWNRTKRKRDGYNGKIACNVCGYFIKKFYIFAGKLPFSNIFLFNLPLAIFF